MEQMSDPLTHFPEKRGTYRSKLRNKLNILDDRLYVVRHPLNRFAHNKACSPMVLPHSGSCDPDGVYARP